MEIDKEFVNKLINDTNIIIKRNKKEINLFDEAINIADLSAREVAFVCTDYGDMYTEVRIEEADPSCSKFNLFITNELYKIGYKNTFSVTEW